ncbi:Hypothetical predicted protein [Paramuricea clavata]|uniref:Uncharacterized protein n=1 Tax=Paramuricea clavata TaxID=317549 RepID=A0A6S7HHR4_PARCT|nr:Hypothetical predicted protein [Paramuricea clavata]
MMKEWKSNPEKETDDDIRQITQGAVDVAEQVIDDARLEMGQLPMSEEGQPRYREIVRDNIRTKFERFRVWAKENMWAVAAIAISIAGIITTVVVAGKKTITGAANGLGAAEKALAKFTKASLPILVPVLNMLSTILGWGTRDLAFLAQNLWIVAIVIAGAIFRNNLGKLLQRRLEIRLTGEKVYDNSAESLLEVYKDLWLHRKQRDDMVEDGVASEATRKKYLKMMLQTTMWMPPHC